MKIIENKILVPVDFLKQSEIALDYAVVMGKATGFEIVLLHILEEGNLFNKMFMTREQEKMIYEHVQNLLNQFADRIKSQVKVSTRLETGKLFDKMVEVAKDIRPKFILIGKTQDPSFTKKIIGSNVLNLIEETTFPILTIRGNKCIIDSEKPVKNLILPLDLRKEVKEQLTAAIHFSKFFKCQVKIITVLNVDSVGAEMQLKSKLGEAKKVIEKEGITCTTTLIKDTTSDLEDLIMKFAVDEDGHIMLIMTHDELTKIHHFIGHTAIDLIEKSPIPILSIKPGKPEDSVFGSFVDPLGVFKG